MQFTNTMTILALSILSSISSSYANPIALESRDVYAPHVTYPHAGTVWKVGQYHNVTWDTSDHPVNITNKIGRIQLRRGLITYSLILADGFDILAGRTTVQVPWVVDGNDYSLNLFGDSGDFSAQFTITS